MKKYPGLTAFLTALPLSFFLFFETYFRNLPAPIPLLLLFVPLAISALGFGHWCFRSSKNGMRAPWWGTYFMTTLRPETR